MNVSYSIWSVIVIPYNLPHWICGCGVETFDACARENFKLKAAVLSTISDFLGDIRSFDGNKDLRHAPIPHSGDDVLNEIKNINLNNENDFREKSKDNMKARLDLQKLGIRKELRPKKNPRSNNLYKPKACYEITRAEKDVFLQTLKSIKPPDEYSSIISCCVQLNERKLIGMKSYDCYMLMQEYLPIALCRTLPDHVSTVLIELCNFFRDLCTLKSYVNNKAYPDGSIAEGYLARESLIFCSRYLCGVETLFTMPIRNDDDDNQNKIESSNFLCPGRPLGQHFHSELPSYKRKKSAAYEIDENNTQEVLSYYGSLKEVVKLNYSGKIRVVLFKCDWVDTQVDKVFYAKDPRLEGWLVVRHVKFKDAFNMGCNSDQNNLYSIPDTCDIPSLYRNEVDGDDEIDVTESMEDEDKEDEDTY
nr:hypothetical protein [Tanacetum cinerariifolium]